jgi:signal peptide peptidase SppA
MYQLINRIPILRNLLPEAPIIPLVPLYGMITASGGFSPGINSDKLLKPLDKAFKIPGIDGVGLLINSPGGVPAQASLIADRIRQLADDHDLPVFAFVEDVAASGGYWLACAADEIYADATSIVGSIGVVSQGFGLDQFIDRYDIERRVYASGDSKVILDPFQPEKESDVEKIKSVQEELHDDFIRHVKQRRGERLDQSADLFNGEFWAGKTALGLGLIDGIGGYHQILEDKFGDSVIPIRLSVGKNWLQRKLLSRTESVAKNMIDHGLYRMTERLMRQRFGL